MVNDVEKSNLHTVVSARATIDSDAVRLANLGYKQEFSRNYSFLSTFSFALSISGLMGTVAITFLYPLISGGPAACCWTWFIGMFGCLAIAYSVAHITSCFPTSGGMYYVITHVVPKKWVPLVCWIDGWLYLIGMIAGACSTDFGAATLLLQTVSMASDYTYVPTNGHITGAAIAVITSHGIINSLPSSVLSRITKYYCFVNIGSVIALIITMLVKCPKINTREFTFSKVINNTGWAEDGWAFLFGFLNVSWVMTCYDSTSRMSEEVSNAGYTTPVAISLALTVTAFLGWILNVVYTLCMGDDIDALINTTSGQPIVQVFDYAMGRKAATAYLSLCFVVLWFCGAVAVCAISRTLWSFSRDRGVPFSWIWYHLDKRTGVPVRTVWLTTLVNCLLTLINLGSSIAMSAIFSACAIATDWSYVLVIFFFMINADRMGVKPGPYNLKKFTKPIMFYACIWTVFVSIVFIFPNYMPVTAQNMNYTVLMLGAVLLFSLIWYMVDARRWYEGPVANVDEGYEAVLETVSGEASDDDSNRIDQPTKS
ncbi:hypothetical protein OGAPHI_006599 [Ogataea philodendri]|uniref:Uncharacterized protein n=1 Tax=Ogataea philodendri TaxID=1378263 RepID=A0A9P8NXE9_9ASCO|nr:uncharacterized protein OGAPHI_006599 [Ogataea philodendri]KAH3661192.1 hypothetical protein OGAPHI_006599 [Ogataea philodendri]